MSERSTEDDCLCKGSICTGIVKSNMHKTIMEEFVKENLAQTLLFAVK